MDLLIILLLPLSLSILFPHNLAGTNEFGQLTSEQDWQNEAFWNFETQIQPIQQSLTPAVEQGLFYGQNFTDLDEFWHNPDENQLAAEVQVLQGEDQLIVLQNPLLDQSNDDGLRGSLTVHTLAIRTLPNSKPNSSA